MPRRRKRRRAGEFYVYRIFDEHQTLYVGKGCRDRLAQQCRRWRCKGEIVEKCTDEAQAFKREKFWIAELHPTENMHPGGNGGWSYKRKPREPVLDVMREFREIERMGTQKAAAIIIANFARVHPRLVDPAILQDANRFLGIPNG